jgi:hypothetical protein
VQQSVHPHGYAGSERGRLAHIGQDLLGGHALEELTTIVQGALAVVVGQLRAPAAAHRRSLRRPAAGMDAWYSFRSRFHWLLCVLFAR